MIDQNHVIVFIWYAYVLNMAFYGSYLWKLRFKLTKITELDDLNHFLYHQEDRENWLDFFLIEEIAILMTVV